MSAQAGIVLKFTLRSGVTLGNTRNAWKTRSDIKIELNETMRTSLKTWRYLANSVSIACRSRRGSTLKALSFSIGEKI